MSLLSQNPHEWGLEWITGEFAPKYLDLLWNEQGTT
jgi:hypothetical protein